MAEAQSPRDLHALVGLGRHATVAELRYAYEQAMSRATRCGDHRHALALSRAFDALNGTRRHEVYGRQRTNVAVSVPAAPRDRPNSAPGRRHARFRAAAERLVVYVIGVPIAVVLGVAFAVHFHVGTGADPPASVHRPAPAIPSPFIQVSTVPAAPAGNFGPTFQVPDTAHVGSNGMATVICQPSPGAAGYTINVRPGALIACTNGATPFVLN